MTLDVSSLQAPVSIRWIKKNTDGSFTDAGGKDLATFEPAQPGIYWGIAWAQDPSVPYWRGALIWLDAEARFGFKQGGWPASDALGGYKSVFQQFTI